MARAGDQVCGAVAEGLGAGAAGAQVVRAEQSALPAQVSSTGLQLLLHACSTTSQSRHSAPVHWTAGARACVEFAAPLAFPAPGPGGSSAVGGARWPAGPAPPQPSARHRASAARPSQSAPHAGSQDCPSRTSTVPLQRLLPFTRRTPSCSPGSGRCELSLDRLGRCQAQGWGWGWAGPAE